ncbi:PR-1-like protein [Hypoxylon trugodes]|uniref:PR-1-like protein n=1 Tax=Hypoxylon trugodes TaxID=326681 RepID=UPI00219F5705|nr:PR-1-like protein [Hypoxylon trugodes]KAI1384231.1 PR-1-like protein [Hypoxylon trugodes]
MAMSILNMPFPFLSRLIKPLSLLLSLLIFTQLAASQTVVQTVVITVAPPIPSEAPSFVDHDTFTSAILNSTNTYRSSYNASSLRWNSTLEAFASTYVSTHSTKRSLSLSESFLSIFKKRDGEKCHMAHSGGPYGENLALGCSDAGSCVDMWASEVSGYNYDDPGFGESTGHFTQLVWRDTTDVGCGAKLCPGNGGWYLACEYWPRGNIIGAFADEVGEPVSGAMALGRNGGWRGVEGVVFGAVVVAWWGLV